MAEVFFIVSPLRSQIDICIYTYYPKHAWCMMYSCTYCRLITCVRRSVCILSPHSLTSTTAKCATRIFRFLCPRPCINFRSSQSASSRPASQAISLTALHLAFASGIRSCVFAFLWHMSDIACHMSDVRCQTKHRAKLRQDKIRWAGQVRSGQVCLITLWVTDRQYATGQNMCCSPGSRFGPPYWLKEEVLGFVGWLIWSCFLSICSA